ncbi:MAG: hypothetical protein OXI60_04055 [Acidiferrobacterales bacterium]|nr:hypothetical protein [Acidiferrobacterales bacterium]
MYSVSSRANDNPGSTWFRSGCALALFLLAAAPAHSDQGGTLVDEVTISSQPAVVSGETITIADDVQSTAIVSEPADTDESSGNITYTEYRYGASTVREFRSGDTLMYIEITPDNGPAYIINRTGDQNPGSTRKRSGMVVTSW